MQLGGGIGEALLPVLAVIVLVDRYVDAAPQPGDANGGMQMRCCRGAEDGEAHRLGGQPGGRGRADGAAEHLVERIGANEIEPRVGERDGFVPGAGRVLYDLAQARAPVTDRRQPGKLRHARFRCLGDGGIEQNDPDGASRATKCYGRRESNGGVASPGFGARHQPATATDCPHSTEGADR